MVHTLLGYLLLPLALWLGIASAWAADPSDVLARALLGTAHDWPFPGQWQSYDVYAYDTLKNHDFQKPYQNALNQLPAAVKQSDGPWLAPMKMTSTLNRFLRTPQGEFVYVSGCKPHDCGNSVGVVFEPATGRLALLLEKPNGSPAGERERRWLVGDHTPAMAALVKAVRAAEKIGQNRLPLPADKLSKAAALLGP